MLNSYYAGSHVSAKKFRKLVELFINGEKIAFTARQLELEQRTVRDIFSRIRKRLEDDCWQRIHPFHPKILNPLFPFQVVHPAARYKSFQMQNDVSRHTAAVVGLFFKDGTVATSILMVERLRLDSGKFPVDKPGDLDKKWLQQRLSTCSFADLQFTSRGCFLYDKDDPQKDNMQTFWLFARLQTSQSDRRNSHKFYLRLKEIEWRFNNLTDQEKADMMNHLETTALQKRKMNKKSEANKIENLKITSINTKLHQTLLELLEKNPIKQVSLMNENILHI